MRPCTPIVWTAALLLSFYLQGFAQGFINLDFEQARLSNLTTNSSTGMVYGSAVASGWTAYLSSVAGGSTTNLNYNNIGLGGTVINLIGTNGGFSPIHGKYFILLQGADWTYGSAASIGQTGTIPANAQSLIFWGSAPEVTFNSQLLSLTSLGSTNGYGIWGADISGFAGQTGELLFTALNGITYNHTYPNGYLPGQWAYIDNIQFSSTAVPEPSTLALGIISSLLLGFRRWQK